MRASRKNRGFTLIELLIAAGMASLVVAAAVTVFVATGTKQRHSERVLEATNASTLAASVMEFEMSSAGYRWPSGAFGFHHVNNMTAADSLTSSGSPITTSANCAGASVGVAPGTDVVEFAQGYEFMSPGKVGAVSGSSVTLSSVLPFTSIETSGGGVGSVLLFVAETGPNVGLSCMGRVLSIAGLSTDGGADSPTTINLDMLDRNFTTGAGAVLGCPAPTMRAYRLGGRTRFMVCGDPASPANMGLFKQSAGVNGNWSTPTRLQEGIEDLQVAPRYFNPSGVMAASGCLTMGTGTNSSICTCNEAIPPTCSLTPTDQNPSPLNTRTSLVPPQKVSLVRGASVEVSGVSNRTRGRGADQLRPASFDHPAATAPDDFDRRRNRFSVTFDNLGLQP